MRSKIAASRLVLVSTVAVSCLATRTNAASVWKVTGPNGGILYLGGSVHALKSTDYPLPRAYNRAFDASTRLAFEADPKELGEAGKSFLTAGQYPRGDLLKNHVDPRTYDYLRRFFRLLKVPEEKYARLRPWYLAALLQAPQLHGLSINLGVEGFLMRRARVHSKPMSGLESSREGIEIFSGLSGRESEALLLLTFIPAEDGSNGRLIDAWRCGDADAAARILRSQFRDFPSLYERFVDARNRNWIPKIEDYLRSRQTYFVIVGAGHLGGPGGLLSLLRTRGYRIEEF